MVSTFVDDMTQIVLNQLTNRFRFSPHLLIDPAMDNQLGIIFSNVLILPLTGVIIAHYVKPKREWFTTLLFAGGLIGLEWIYVQSGFLVYLDWSIWLDAVAYVIAIRILVHYVLRLQRDNPPVPHWFRILTFSYSTLMWPGSVLGGAMLGWYQWRPGFFERISADDRFADLGFGLILACIAAYLTPRFLPAHRPVLYLALTMFAVLFTVTMHRQGVLIYHQWNEWLTALRYLVPFTLVTLYDQWETAQYAHRLPN